MCRVGAALHYSVPTQLLFTVYADGRCFGLRLSDAVSEVQEMRVEWPREATWRRTARVGLCELEPDAKVVEFDATAARFFEQEEVTLLLRRAVDKINALKTPTRRVRAATADVAVGVREGTVGSVEC